MCSVIVVDCCDIESMENLIVPMVRTRTEDEKVRVRRNAVQTLEAIIRLDMDNIKKEVGGGGDTEYYYSGYVYTCRMCWLYMRDVWILHCL